MGGAYLSLAVCSWRKLKRSTATRQKKKERGANRLEGEKERPGTRQNRSSALSEITNADNKDGDADVKLNRPVLTMHWLSIVENVAVSIVLTVDKLIQFGNSLLVG